MRVLAFDAATHVGWAAFAGARAMPVLGTYDLPTGTAAGKRNLALLRQVQGLIKEHQPDVVAFEAPIYLPHDRYETRRLLTGLATVIELAAEIFGLRSIEVAPNTAKVVLTGNGRAGKNDMVVAAVNMGWPVADDHQADACAVAIATYRHLQIQGAA